MISRRIHKIKNGQKKFSRPHIQLGKVFMVVFD